MCIVMRCIVAMGIEAVDAYKDTSYLNIMDDNNQENEASDAGGIFDRRDASGRNSTSNLFCSGVGIVGEKDMDVERDADTNSEREQRDREIVEGFIDANGADVPEITTGHRK